jgi:type II secretory pathway component GspD/PulD (secretin)
MRRHLWLSTTLAGLSAACLFVSGPVRGQAPADAPKADTPAEMTIITIQGDLAAVAQTLQALADDARVQVVVSPNSSNLILRGPAEGLKSLEAVIRAIDRPAQQVELRILVAELSGSEGATPTFDQDFEVAAAQVAQLQRDGAASLLKRIQVTALENSRAMIQVGEVQPVVTGQNFVGGGPFGGGRGGQAEARQAQRVYQMESTGTLVEVTPRVAAGDKVLLELSFEMSRLAPEAKPDPDQPADFTPQGKTTAALRTTVAVPNAQTVTLTDFASASSPDDARLIMLISARVVP